MPFNTLSVATAVTPSVIETYFSHYLNRGPLRQKPTAHISYHEGLRLIRQFLDYSSKHAVEDLQAFTAQWVPAPTWVRIQDSEIAPQFLERAAQALHAQLGRRDLDKIGGKTWWQWRRPEAPLRAEWIEMKKDFNERKRAGTKCERVILYVHGGAYYFGSVDEHRYQMQRHARKLKARVLAPRYRLAPQFPFPCGLYDCIATYLYLLEHFAPNQILFAGDSAGGGMVLSMLVTLRDQGFPLPAGTILLSPWVDLTHSFPSVAGDGVGDYIPPHGFHHKPSMAWPPPPSDQIQKVAKIYDQPPPDVVELPVTEEEGANTANSPPPPPPIMDDNMSITLDGKKIELKEQIQLYAPNDLLSHPLVSPVMQPSLGGLPPMLIQVGGGELLRDEQIYIAHKAANPKAFPPSDAVLSQYDPKREMLDKYPPTDVQLQVWEDLCHVPHTLSFTRPAKYMYRSVAQFGAWALAHAQQKGIDIQDDDAISVISSGPEDGDANASSTELRRRKTNGWPESTNNDASASKSDLGALGAVGKAGDPLPPFKDHMVRQRVTRHGVIYPLAPQAEIACLALDPASIGAIKPGPVRKWLAKKRENDVRFGNDKKKIQKKRAKELASGYDSILGEMPPPTALVGRRRKGVAPEEKKKGKSWGLAMWSGWGSHHDESTLEREEKFDATARQAGGAEKTVQPRPDNAPSSQGQSSLVVPGQAADQGEKTRRRLSSTSAFSAPWSQKDKERPRSPYRQVTDTGQAGQSENGSPRLDSSTSSVRPPWGRRSSSSTSFFTSRPVSVAVPPTTGALAPESVQVPGSQNTYLDPAGNRPHNGVVAYPFKLRNPMQSNNPSTATIDSQAISAMSNSDPTAGPIEMPTPADERSVPRSAIDQTEPLSAVSAASGGMPLARSVTPQSAGTEPTSPVFSTPMSTTSFKPFDPVFRDRTSVLGSIGADGMPTAPLLARTKTVESPSDPGSALSTLEGSPRSPNVDGTPASPVDGAKVAAPFKVRNPVFDARAANATANVPAPVATAASPVSPPTQTPPLLPVKAGEATEPSKAAPFKLRHAVIDPKVAPVRSQTPDSARSATSTPSPQQPRTAETIANRAVTPVQTAGSADLPPNSNVVMPTVVARRQVERPQNAPPKPPPKDDVWRKTSTTPKGGLDKKPSLTALPRSKFNTAPLLDDLNFGRDEEKRLGLESFMTANEGDVKRPGV